MKTKIVYLNPNELKPYEKNPRHNDDAVQAVAESIREFGFKVPIVIDSDKIIVAGHTRWKASGILGLSEVPCIVADDLTPEQVRAFRLADNKVAELSDWDYELLDGELDGLEDWDISKFGFSIKEVDREVARIEDKKRKISEVPVPQEDKVPKRVQAGDVWELGSHRLMCGDSTSSEDLDTLMGGGQSDLIVTDPPYNVAYTGRTTGESIQNDDMADDEFLKFLTSAFKAMEPHLKKGGAFYIWHASMNTQIFRRACDLAGLTTHQILVWVKNIFAFGRSDYRWRHELCLYGWKEGATHYFIKDRTQSTVTDDLTIGMMSEDELREALRNILNETPTTVLYDKKPASNDLHPTMKPISLIAKQIANSTLPGQVVLDVFGGSGTTMLACEQLDRPCRMMELDPHYCDVIIARFEEFSGKKAKKLN